MISTLLRRGFAIGMLSGIFYLSHQPSIDLIPPLFPMQDKLLHAIEFFVLGIALLLNRDLRPGGIPILIVFLAGASWGVLDEIHQSFVPGRDCSAGDLLADIVGLAASLTLRKPLLGALNPSGGA